jgi:hypothetical protein
MLAVVVGWIDRPLRASAGLARPRRLVTRLNGWHQVHAGRASSPSKAGDLGNHDPRIAHRDVVDVDQPSNTPLLS